MSNVSTERSAATKEKGVATPPAATESTTTTAAVPRADTVPTHTNGLSRFRRAIALIEKHPVKVIAAGVAAAALIEVELALGLLLGIGATLLFVARPGVEARRDLVDTGKLLFGRARGASAVQPASAPPAPSDAA